jgi:hypothetical protein
MLRFINHILVILLRYLNSFSYNILNSFVISVTPKSPQWALWSRFIAIMWGSKTSCRYYLPQGRGDISTASEPKTQNMNHKCSIR